MLSLKFNSGSSIAMKKLLTCLTFAAALLLPSFILLYQSPAFSAKPEGVARDEKSTGTLKALDQNKADLDPYPEEVAEAVMSVVLTGARFGELAPCECKTYQFGGVDREADAAGAVQARKASSIKIRRWWFY